MRILLMALTSLLVCLPSLAQTTPNISFQNQPGTSDYKLEVERKLQTEREKYLLQVKKGDDSKLIEQSLVNITFLEMEKTKLQISKDTPRKMSSTKNKSAFTYRGHFQWRTESAHNRQGVQGSQQSEQSFSRLRTYLTFSPNNHLHFNLTPQATKVFGGDVSVAGAGNTTSVQGTSGSINHTGIDFFEANVDYHLNDSLSFKIGRQEMAYGDDLIIGALPWANNGRSFDAIRSHYKHGWGWTDFWVSKISDNGVNGNALMGNDDHNFMGIYHSMNINETVKTLDVYYLYDSNETGATELEINTWGIRAVGNIGSLFYRTENGYQEGAGLGEDAFQMNAEVGSQLGRFKISGEYAVAGADYRQLYPTAHKFQGFADVLGRRNIENATIHVNTAITDDLSIRLDFHDFKRLRTDTSAFQLMGVSWGTTGNSDDIGTEVDAVLNIKAPHGLKLQLGASYFSPGQYMKDQNGGLDDDTAFYYGQILANF